MLHMRLLPKPVAPVGGAQLWPVATPSVGSSVAQYARYPECANAPPPFARGAQHGTRRRLQSTQLSASDFSTSFFHFSSSSSSSSHASSGGGGTHSSIVSKVDSHWPEASDFFFGKRDSCERGAGEAAVGRKQLGGRGSAGAVAALSLSQVLERWPRDGPARACLARASGGVLEGSRRVSGGGQKGSR